jgi:hypothetical protein
LLKFRLKSWKKIRDNLLQTILSTVAGVEINGIRVVMVKILDCTFAEAAILKF